jgi:hypothetical protein
MRTVLLATEVSLASYCTPRPLANDLVERRARFSPAWQRLARGMRFADTNPADVVHVRPTIGLAWAGGQLVAGARWNKRRRKHFRRIFKPA